MNKFEIYKDIVGEYRWRLKAKNGEIVSTSEGYTTKASAKISAQKMKLWASTAIIVEV